MRRGLLEHLQLAPRSAATGGTVRAASPPPRARSLRPGGRSGGGGRGRARRPLEEGRLADQEVGVLARRTARSTLSGVKRGRSGRRCAGPGSVAGSRRPARFPVRARRSVRRGGRTSTSPGSHLRTACLRSRSQVRGRAPCARAGRVQERCSVSRSAMPSTGTPWSRVSACIVKSRSAGRFRGTAGPAPASGRIPPGPV